MTTGIIGLVLLAIFVVPVILLNFRKGKKNDKETEENK